MGDMQNLVMVMPYQAYIRKAQAEGFRIHAIWDPAEAERLFGAQAAHYLRDVEALADGFRLVDFTDHAPMPTRSARPCEKPTPTTSGMSVARNR